MSIITISRRPFSRGREVAIQVAQKLGYACIAREVLFDTAKNFNIHDAKIIRAIHDAPSFSDHFLFGRERYLAFFQATLLEILRRDNIVYHGLAGHFFIQGVSHGLKIRIITSLEERVRTLTEREAIGPKNAALIIKREDNDRRRWSQHLYGIDTWDPSLYDMVLNIAGLSVDEAVEIICQTVRLKRFQTTTESRRRLEDLALAARVKAALVETKPDIDVSAQNGHVHIKTDIEESREAELCSEIIRIAGSVPGVGDVAVETGHVVRHYD